MNRKNTQFSTENIFLSCPLFSQCGGCEIQKDYHLPPIFSEIKEFFLKRGVNFSLYRDKLTAWRMRAKLAVRGSSSNPEIGLFRKGTHEVLSIPDCPMHHPLINEAVKIVKDCMVKHAVTPYQEIFSNGDLRYMQFVVEECTGRIQLALVFNARDEQILQRPQIASFLQDLSNFEIWHSIWLNCNPKASNTIFSDFWFLYFGERYVKQKLLDKQLYLHPASFMQTHFSLFTKLVSSLKEKIHAHKKVVELYSGVGGIGFSVLEKSKSVVCSEINPFAKECFEKTKEKLPQEEQSKISFQTLSAQDSVFLLKDSEVLIVDPPRKGVDKEVLQEIVTSSTLEQVVYVSCYFSSFAKDIQFLKAHGWHIECAEGYLLFPGTNQIEVLCFLQKSG